MIPLMRRGIWPFFFVSLCPSVCIAQGTNDGAAAASNRPGTYEGLLPGPRKVWQMLRALGGGTRSRSSTKGGVFGPFCAILDPLCALPRAQYDRVAAASNRPGTCQRWSPGPRQVCPMLRAFSGGHRVLNFHQRHGNWLVICHFMALPVHRQGHKRRGGVR